MSDHDNDDDINDENRFSSYRIITMMMFFMKMVRTQNGQKMGNVQATASHDDNTDNNDNYVEDDLDKKDNTGPAVSSQCEIFSILSTQNMFIYSERSV